MMTENLYEKGISNTMKLTSDSYPILTKISQWTKFLSIVGFVFIGLSILIVLSVGALITGMNQYAISTNDLMYIPGMFSWTYAISLIIILGIYFIPVYLLFQFSSKLKKALELNDTERLTTAFDFLKKHYVYIGIITIIALSFYIICFLMLLTVIFSVM